MDVVLVVDVAIRVHTDSTPWVLRELDRRGDVLCDREPAEDTQQREGRAPFLNKVAHDGSSVGDGDPGGIATEGCIGL